MNKILTFYLLKNFLKTFLLVTLIFFCFGTILNLFEEIEFFKNLNTHSFMPLILTSFYMPSMIIKGLPFIIFISSLWYMVKIKNSKDLLTLKVYGFSNIKILLVFSLTSFLLGWMILLVANPITSSMSKYYEKTKSIYSKDIDHLITFNRNGLWIKENVNDHYRIITADKTRNNSLSNVLIFHFDKKSELIEKISAKKANIRDFNWKLNQVQIFKINDGILKKINLENYEITSIYNLDKIENLYKNFDTLSFLDLVFNFKKLQNNGYNFTFLNQSLHTMLSLPFFLFMMSALASIFSISSLIRSNNFKLIALGLVTCVLTFYFKDLSLALGQTDRVPIILAIWSPIFILTLFSFISLIIIRPTDFNIFWFASYSKFSK